MVKLAYIFPGQGAQYVGMGKDLYENSSPARQIFETADEVLGFNLSSLCFNGPEDELNRTVNSQVAVLTVSIAAQMAFKFQNPAVTPVFTAGLSLGEYSALVSAGSLSIDNSLKLVSKRARFMKEASLKNPGKMLAIIGLSRQEVAEISGLSGAQIANLNSPAQIVVSGTNSQIEHAERLAREKGAKKAVVLKIEGPYHSRLMDEAAVLLEEELTKIEIKKPLVPVVANVTASCEETSEDIKSNLVKQLNHKTLWEDSIRLMISKGIKDFVEIGPGKVLKGILRRIDQDLTVYSIEKTADLDKLLNC